MRIISGQYKSRRINPPAGLPVRPTTDKAKEALFNILMPWEFEDLSVLDLFAGTGNISYEFVSRGCRKVTAVEKDRKCVNFILKVEEDLGMQTLNVRQANVFKFLQRANEQYDIIFADPPYQLDELESLPGLVFEYGLLKEEGIFILEHDDHHDFSSHPYIFDKRKYGKVHFSIFSKSE